MICLYSTLPGFYRVVDGPHGLDATLALSTRPVYLFLPVYTCIYLGFYRVFHSVNDQGLMTFATGGVFGPEFGPSERCRVSTSQEDESQRCSREREIFIFILTVLIFMSVI